MERIKVDIMTNTAAMQEQPATEIVRILRRMALEFEEYGGPLDELLYDSTGCYCGVVTVTSEEG